jgi:superfamily I DNA and/or RNA helicase
MKKDIKNNCFMHYINRSLFECLITLKYFHILLTEQYRAIFIINDIGFTVWYKAQMHFSVNSSLRFNMIIAIIVLKSFCEIKWFLTFFNINEIDIRIDASQFKQNEIEVIVVIELVKIYAEVKISVKNIIILTKYTVQVQLLKRSLVLDSKFQNVEAYMIDSFQDKEASVVILCMMRTRKLDFMSFFNHLLTVYNYACNLFVILCNYDKLQHDYTCNLYMIRHVQNLFSINEVYEEYFSQ